MFRKLIYGAGLLLLTCSALQAQIMTDFAAAPMGPIQPMPGIQAMPMQPAANLPSIGTPYTDAGACGAECAPACAPCMDCCRYVKLFGGWTQLDDYENSNGPFAVTGTFEDGYAAGGALGRLIRPWVNAEIEFCYRNNEGDQWTGQATEPWDGEIETYSGMTNFLFQGCRRIGHCNPYVGAGAGFAFVNGDLSTQTLNHTIDDTGFAYQFMAGISRPISCNVDTFVEYRYFSVEDLVVDQSVSTQPPVPGGDFDYRSHNVFFGIRLCH